jgi:hypothetical protein
MSIYLARLKSQLTEDIQSRNTSFPKNKEEVINDIKGLLEKEVGNFNVSEDLNCSR